MVFDNKQKNTEIKYSSNHLAIEIESERNNELDIIKTVFSKEVKYLSKTNLIKLAIDNLVNDIEKEDTEEKGIEYLKELYKEMNKKELN